MGIVHTLVKMVKNMKAIGLMEWSMAMGYMNGVMEGNMMASTNMTKDMDLE